QERVSEESPEALFRRPSEDLPIVAPLRLDLPKPSHIVGWHESDAAIRILDLRPTIRCIDQRKDFPASDIGMKSRGNESRRLLIDKVLRFERCGEHPDERNQNRNQSQQQESIDKELLGPWSSQLGDLCALCGESAASRCDS